MENNRNVSMLVIVAAMGYFVDIYDLSLFGIVRIPSLEEMGLSGDELEEKGKLLINMQMMGMLVGGILFGILGDTLGRVKVLFGSIIMYSLANIANGFVYDITSYAIIRFIAGVGLSGELGAGITLISETMHREKRGYGTMVIVVVGALGAVVAAMVGDTFNWRTAYFVGGGLGLLLLALRVGTFESGMFKNLKQTTVKRGDFLSLFTNGKRLRKYLACILIGIPIWYAVGVLVYLSPEFSRVLDVHGTVKAGTAIMYCYIGLSFGDLLSGLLSQLLRSRKKVILFFLVATIAVTLMFLYNTGISLEMFYFQCFLIGTCTGYWALFVTVASEQFGTNLRSTVTTTVPNFVRGSLVLVNLVYSYLKGYSAIGIIYSALIVGVVCTAAAFLATLSVEESFSKDLDYVEEG
ncbi:MAG TPA: MFS transporter [Bacteroidia bacterium]|nr:MFS transporter [Bacteroidia bacterium]